MVRRISHFASYVASFAIIRRPIRENSGRYAKYCSDIVHISSRNVRSLSRGAGI